MITKLLLAAGLCASAIAGTLTDSATVFGPNGKNFSDSIASLPVWIETQEKTPPNGLKDYADAQVKELTQHGFLLVVTTQPRAWRVSMNPVGLASSEGVRLAGDAMVKEFKTGNFADGAIILAEDLNQLTTGKAVSETSDSRIVLWSVSAIFGLVVLVGIVIVVATRRNTRREAEIREQRKVTPTPKPTVEQARAHWEQVSNAPNAAQAKQVFDSYTPVQRETIIQERHHHHYSSGASTDPLLFYMLLNSSQPHYYAPTTIYEAPEPSRHHSPPPEPDRSSSSSSDYSSSSSSSFDSGSSSFDSGSSFSDSSGSGGSW